MLKEDDAVCYTYVTDDTVYLNATEAEPYSEAPFDAAAVWALAKLNPGFLSKRMVSTSRHVITCVVVVELRSGQFCIKSTEADKNVLTPVEVGHAET